MHCRRCSDVTTSCPGLGANEITAVRPNIELNGHFVRMLGRMGLHSWKATWCFMTHGTVIQFVDRDRRTLLLLLLLLLFMKLHYLTERHTASKQQKSAPDTKRLWGFSLTLIVILLPSSPLHQFFHNEVTRISEYDLCEVAKHQYACYSHQ